MRPGYLRFQLSFLALVAGMAMPALAQSEAAPAPAPKDKAADDNKPESVVVTGTRNEVVSKVDRMSFDVSKDLQVQTGTLADALRAVPGVEVDLQGVVSLRGDSGVKILVDGRPSALLSGEGRSTAIMTMPAGQIERVEVITNPSAAMSPEGSAGVINIVMKKARKDTRYATVRANVGGLDRYGLGLNAVSSGSKLTLTSDLGYRHFEGESEVNQDRVRTDPLTGGVETGHRHNRNEQQSKGGNARVAADYDFDKTTRLSSELSYFNFGTQLSGKENVESTNPEAVYDRVSDNDYSNKGVSGSLSMRHSFSGEGHELTAEASIFDAKFDQDSDATTTPEIADPVFESFHNSGRWNMKNAKVEYKKPTGKDSALDVGYEGEFNNYDFDYFGAHGPDPANLVPDPAFTNQFELGETVHALFGTYSFKIGKLEAMPGLRLEEAELDIHQVTDAVRFKNDYFRAYPTLHLGYALGKTQKLRASYSRRIQRPGAQDLNPYTVYIDPLNIRRGNPFLRPQTTDSFELGWERRKGPAFLSLTGFFRDSKDGVTDIYTDLGNGVILTTRENLAKARNIGVEAIANGKVSKTLTYNASATWQWSRIDPRTGGVSHQSSGATGTLRGTLNWQPNKKDFFQLSGNYSGRQLLPQGHRDAFGILNLGYRRKINDKLSLLATAQNVLDSVAFTTVYRTPTVTEHSRQTGNGRILSLGGVYTFGNTGGKAPRDPSFDFQQGSGSPGQ